MSPETQFEQFLEPFLSAETSRLRAEAEGDAAVIVAGLALRQFRLHPQEGLNIVRSTLRTILQAERPPARVVWCQEGDSASGLDDFELIAILGRWLYVTYTRTSRDQSSKRVVVVGQPRIEKVAVGLSGDALTDSQVVSFLERCRGTSLSAAVLFLSAGRVSRIPIDSLAAAELVRHQASGGATALLVPDAETEAALREPRRQCEPFARLGLHVQLVRFERGELIEAAALGRFMRETGLACDSSVPFRDSDSPSTVIRHGAYSGTSAYRPQPFDLRVPWFKCEPDMWVELPLFPLAAGSLSEHLQGPSDTVLADRLDAHRMAAFFRASRISPALDSEYPGYRIYNWPRPAPASRVTMVDGGDATVEGLGAAEGALAQASCLTLTVVGQEVLLESARHEVAERYGLSTSRAIEAQNALHTYLADVPRGSALRQDYAEFVRFAPAGLGDALEIGSGYGVLAWALSLRARRYVCADLDYGMFRGLRSDLGQAGVVADAHQLPFADDAFDSVIANNVIEHLYDPLAGLQEIHRVLKPGGRLIALLPFDALNNRHDLPAHLWKIDQQGLEAALQAAGYAATRIEIVNLHDLGVPGAFPSCYGFAAMVDAQRGHVSSDPARPTVVVRESVPVTKARSERAGRVWPSVRELARFEEWQGRRVVVVGGDPEDGHEFEHFGARVTRVSADTVPWTVPDGVADLVYSFLSVGVSQLPRLADEINRVLATSGVVVAVFRNRDGLRRLARVGSYFGAACDLNELADVRAVTRIADDADAVGEDGYWSLDEATRAFGGFSHRRITISDLTPDDLATDVTTPYPELFWDWLSATCGRFVMVRARR